MNVALSSLKYVLLFRGGEGDRGLSPPPTLKYVICATIELLHVQFLQIQVSCRDLFLFLFHITGSRNARKNKQKTWIRPFDVTDSVNKECLIGNC